MSSQHATQTNDKAVTEFANPVALAAFAGGEHGERGIRTGMPIPSSATAPQMASVIDLLAQDEHISRTSPASSQTVAKTHRETRLHRLGKLRSVNRVRRAGWPVLNMTTGLLSNAFPTAAPLFHGCLAFLQLKLHTKNQAESLPTTQGHRVL